MRIEVECSAGYRGEETPRRMRIGLRPVEILEVVDRWLSPDHRYFKVKTAGRSTMIIRHDVETLDWELHHYVEDGAVLHPAMAAGTAGDPGRTDGHG